MTAAKWGRAGLAATCLLAAAALGGAAEDEVTVTFAFDPGAASPRRVCVAGEFNGWAPDAWPLARGADGVFRREARLAPGVYRYKFVVDGAWTHDPKNPRREPDGHRNSVLVVGDAPPPDLASRPHPRPTRARAGAFHVLEAAALPAPPAGLPPRPVFVYTPPSYEREAARRYPVLYAHDGQNVWSEDGICFGHGGWYLDEALDRLAAAGAIEEVLLVAVPHGADRMAEYGAGWEGYGAFLRDVVKPAVDARFRTRPGPRDTALLGSSMGGLVSFKLALASPDVFGAAACLSSSFWFKTPDGRTAFDHLAARDRAGPRPRLYLDSGTAGPSQDGAPDTRRMRDALRAAGWTARDLAHHEAAGATHDERAWRARVDVPLRFLFNAGR
ncbi:MAG: hypothetical protein KF878_11315 [Planctomycetes bacterium]|nr:hypothetical protein [Planctomycetota bacterium]